MHLSSRLARSHNPSAVLRRTKRTGHQAELEVWLDKFG